MERNGQIVFRHRGYTARHWAPSDRKQAGDVIRQCLESYGLQFEPQGADRDALEVEEFYQKKNKGEFWVVMEDSTGKLVGTGGYYEVGNGHEGEKEELGNCKGRVEIRKMYLAPAARGKQLGRTLLQVCLHHSLCCTCGKKLNVLCVCRSWRKWLH